MKTPSSNHYPAFSKQVLLRTVSRMCHMTSAGIICLPGHLDWTLLEFAECFPVFGSLIGRIITRICLKWTATECHETWQRLRIYMPKQMTGLGPAGPAKVSCQLTGVGLFRCVAGNNVMVVYNFIYVTSSAVVFCWQFITLVIRSELRFST